MVNHLVTRSGANYNTAWELLIRRYDNAHKQFNDNLERLVELPPLTEESAYKIKTFLDAVNEYIVIIKRKGTLEEVLAQLVLGKMFQTFTSRVRKHHLKTN